MELLRVDEIENNEGLFGMLIKSIVQTPVEGKQRVSSFNERSVVVTTVERLVISTALTSR